MARAGDTVTVSLTSDEVIAAPHVLIAGAVATVSGGGTSWTAAHVVVDDAAAGDVSVLVAYTDLAGNRGANRTATTDLSRVAVDTTPPSLDSVSIVSSNSRSTVRAADGDTLTLTFAGSESLKVTTVNMAGRVASVSSSASGAMWVATSTVAASDAAEGPVGISIEFTDMAGNAGNVVTTTTDNSSVWIDYTTPAILSATMVSTNTGNKSQATEGDTIELALVFSEPVAAPAVTIAGQTAVVTGEAAAWLASFTVSANIASEGEASIAVAFADIVGNVGIDIVAT